MATSLSEDLTGVFKIPINTAAITSKAAVMIQAQVNVKAVSLTGPSIAALQLFLFVFPLPGMGEAGCCLPTGGFLAIISPVMILRPWFSYEVGRIVEEVFHRSKGSRE
jgi:hypothetical protein